MIVNVVDGRVFRRVVRRRRVEAVDGRVVGVGAVVALLPRLIVA